MHLSPYRAFFLLLVAALPALADEGVTEINQAKALAGGVTPGDGAGFPVSITVGGSYRLTGNLDVRFLGLPTSANTTAIAIDSSTVSVAIDLNGFSILGPTTCDGTSCTNAGTGDGIATSGIGSFAEITNGSIIGMGRYGISLGGGRISHVLSGTNGGVGLFLGIFGGTISDCLVSSNGGPGIKSNAQAVISHSVAKDNVGIGIDMLQGVVDSCETYSNNGGGIRLTEGVVKSCDSGSNAVAQLTCSTGCALQGNRFGGCTGAACFSGAGTRLQTPPSSNMCGAAVCP